MTAGTRRVFGRDETRGRKGRQKRNQFRAFIVQGEGGGCTWASSRELEETERRMGREERGESGTWRLIAMEEKGGKEEKINENQ